MTAGQFAKKYGIDYQTVRAASFRTATRQRESWALDYGEPELRRAVREELAERIAYHQEILDKICLEIANLDRKEGAPDE